MKNPNRPVTRRRFLETTTAAIAAPLIAPRTVLGLGDDDPPNARITIGIIGLSSRGFYLLNSFLSRNEAEVVAVCDVHREHYRDNPWGKGNVFGRDPAQERVAQHYARTRARRNTSTPAAYSDYRQVLAREDIDAVVVATPDHWHAPITLAALTAGKDVYCEKPVTHFFAEGQRVYRAAAAHEAVFQAGSQQRSAPRFRHAAALVRNGVLGKIERVEVGLPPGYNEPMGDPTVTEPPEHLDYDFWCGPGPVLPYMRARHHRWWRGHTAYGGGVLMDFIGHHNDIAHWGLGMDAAGPVKVEAVGWTAPETDIYDTPHHYEIRCEYPGGVVSSISSTHDTGTKWIGENGWVYVQRGHLAASNPQWVERDFDPGPVALYDSPGHTENFLACVRSREACIAPAETAHRAITPGHLGYVSNALGRPVQWDAGQETIVDDPEAQERLMAMQHRAPWTLPDT
ncbi:MAG: Gfo/Idh/MocA family protein [Candidatus Hydrogenedentota bacterium]